MCHLLLYVFIGSYFTPLTIHSKRNFDQRVQTFSGHSEVSEDERCNDAISPVGGSDSLNCASFAGKEEEDEAEEKVEEEHGVGGDYKEQVCVTVAVTGRPAILLPITVVLSVRKELDLVHGDVSSHILRGLHIPAIKHRTTADVLSRSELV